MPKLIEIEEVQAGMKLHKAIHNRFGQLILSEGTKLEEKHKRVLKTWGVKAVYVADTSESGLDNEQEQDERTKILAEEYLKKKMRWAPRNSYEESMYQIAVKRTMQKLVRLQNDFN